MKKTFVLMAAVAALMVPGFSSAQNPTVALLETVDLSGLGSLVTGVATNGSDAYVVSFSDRRVIKVTGAVTTSRSTAVLARTDSADTNPAPLAGTQTWAAGRGLITADFRDGKLLVSGQAGAIGDRGVALIVNPDTGALVNELATGLDGGNNFATGGACFYDADSILASYTAGTNYFSIGGDLQSLQGGGFVGGPNNPSFNEVARDLVGTTNGSGQAEVYVAYNTAFLGGTVQIGLHRLVDTDADGVIEGTAAGDTQNASWYTLAPVADAGSSVTGTAILNHIASGKKYVALCNRGDGKVGLVNTANSADNVALDISATVTRPGDVAFATVGSSQFMLVTEFDGAENNLHIFGIDGAALVSSVPTLSAEGWENYQ